QPLLLGGELSRVRQPDLVLVQPTAAVGRRWGALTGPGVEAEMMVIAAGGDEECTRIAADRDVEAERAGIERLGRREVADVEVDVPDARAGRHARPGVLAAELAQDAIEVERKRVHLQDSVADRPLLPRAVAIQLDPVALRIAQIEGLADQVVGRAAQPPARL